MKMEILCFRWWEWRRRPPPKNDKKQVNDEGLMEFYEIDEDELTDTLADPGVASNGDIKKMIENINNNTGIDDEIIHHIETNKNKVDPNNENDQRSYLSLKLLNTLVRV